MTDPTQIIRERSLPMDPIATMVEPKLTPLPGIQAVIFDIYGTLLVSGSGDISIASKENRDGAIRSALAAIGLDPPIDAPLFERLKGRIAELHAHSRERGVDFPEVEIRDVWHELIAEFGGDPNRATAEEVAVRYEVAANPIWPMPGLVDSLKTIEDAGLRMGIVSNAQFYTPLAFPALVGKTLDELCFDEDLCVWSYRELAGKPSSRLFAKLKSALESRGIAPEASAFVGNDMLNDVWSAAAAGMRTVLFAGDERSLRMREKEAKSDDCPHPPVEADAVITDLRQLPGLFC